MCKIQCVNWSASQTSWTNQLDRLVLFIWSLGQFAYSKIFLSVCTLSQLPSPTKALLKSLSSFFGWWLYSMGGDPPIWVVTTLWMVLPLLVGGCLLKKGWSPTTEDSYQPQRVVTDLKISIIKLLSYFISSMVFVKCLGLKN